MIRDIRYRAWYKKYKIMLYDITDISFDHNIFCCSFIGGCGDTQILSIDEIILMEFTGLYDINKNEIWENDVVIVHRYDSFPSYISKVIFRSGCYGTLWDNPVEKKDNPQFVPLFGWPVEKIGNIHIHPSWRSLSTVKKNDDYLPCICGIFINKNKSKKHAIIGQSMSLYPSYNSLMKCDAIICPLCNEYIYISDWVNKYKLTNCK